MKGKGDIKAESPKNKVAHGKGSSTSENSPPEQQDNSEFIVLSTTKNGKSMANKEGVVYATELNSIIGCPSYRYKDESADRRGPNLTFPVTKR